MADLVEGKKYWCILHSDETMEYHEVGKILPCVPWQGFLHIKQQGMLQLWRSLEDDDTNSRATVRHSQIFASLDAAKSAYIVASEKYQVYLHEEQERLLRQVVEVLLTKE